MFDFFQNLQEQQKEMQAKLSEILIEETSEDGMVHIVMDCNRRLRDITINPEMTGGEGAEQLEDLLVVTFNAAVEKAEVKAEAEMRKLMGGMLPGGLDQLLGG